MENLNIFVPRLLDSREYFTPGQRACQGCGETVALRQIMKSVGRNVILANATGCSEIISSPFPQTAWRVPWIHVAFENAAAVASGVEAGMKALERKGALPKRNVKVMAIAGDGATADIGFQALSGAVERGHNFVYVCLDNEAYMNTGIQRSGATPFGASTTTAPAGKVSPGKQVWKKNVPEIMVAHRVPYVATASHSHPLDLITKVKKARALQGPAYIHCLSVCPTGWRIPPHACIKVARLAVETGIFPLYEVEEGKYRLTVDSAPLRPVEDYLSIQGRFRHLTPAHTAAIQHRVTQEYHTLLEKIHHLRAWAEVTEP